MDPQKLKEMTEAGEVRQKRKNEFAAIMEPDGEWFVAFCPEIPGANGQGKTCEESRANLAEAIALILKERADSLPQGTLFSQIFGSRRRWRSWPRRRGEPMKDASDLLALGRGKLTMDLKGLLTICIIQGWEVSGGCRSGRR